MWHFGARYSTPTKTSQDRNDVSNYRLVKCLNLLFRLSTQEISKPHIQHLCIVNRLGDIYRHIRFRLSTQDISKPHIQHLRIVNRLGDIYHHIRFAMRKVIIWSCDFIRSARAARVIISCRQNYLLDTDEPGTELPNRYAKIRWAIYIFHSSKIGFSMTLPSAGHDLENYCRHTSWNGVRDIACEAYIIRDLCLLICNWFTKMHLSWTGGIKNNFVKIRELLAISSMYIPVRRLYIDASGTATSSSPISAGLWMILKAILRLGYKPL